MITDGAVRMFVRARLSGVIDTAAKVIITDSDWTDRIGGQFFRPDRIVRAKVEFNAHVTQVVGRFSRSSLVGWFRDSDGAALRTMRRRWRTAGATGAGWSGDPAALPRRAAHAGGRDQRPDRARPGPAGATRGYESLKLPDCCATTWFGALLGRDEWKSYGRIIVVGQP